MKKRLIDWLFKEYKREVHDSADKALELQMEAFKATLDIKDLIRERFKGVRPQHPDQASLLETHMAGLDENSLLGFLAKAKEIVDNPTFMIVTKSLILESIEHAALESVDMIDVNFNRASVNGVQLVEDTMQSLDTQYRVLEERNKTMTEEERLSAL